MRTFVLEKSPEFHLQKFGGGKKKFIVRRRMFELFILSLLQASTAGICSFIMSDIIFGKVSSFQSVD